MRRVHWSMLMGVMLAVTCAAYGQVSPNDGDGVIGGRGERATTTPTAPVVLLASPQIPVHVTDYSNVARTNSPVSGGIPIKRGVLQDSDLAFMVLVDGASEPVASFQTPVALGHWGDGSVKWLLLNFNTTIPANGSATYTLGLTTTPPTHAGITVTQDSNTYTVNTGTLKAILNKNTFSFMDQAWVDVNNDGNYTSDEMVVSGPGDMFIDLDDVQPGAADAGAYDYPTTWYFGMEGGNWLRDSMSATSTRYKASDGDYSISVFRQGTAETVFKMEGWHRNLASGRQFGKYTVYVYFYAGKSFVRASQTWIMTGDPANNWIRRMGIELPVNLGSSTLNYAIGGPFETQGTPVYQNANEIPYIPLNVGPATPITGTVGAAQELYLLSIGPDKYFHNLNPSYDVRVEYNVVKNGTSVASGYSPCGWTDLNNGTTGVAMGVQDFWREHPKEINYNNGVMTAYIWPDHGDKTLDLRRRYPEVRGAGPLRGGTWGDAARREFGNPGSAVGTAKTTDLFFYFHKGTHTQATVDAEFRGFQDQLIPFVSGDYNCDTGVFGPVHPYDPDNFPKLENYFDLLMLWVLRAGEDYHWYGMLDYGQYLIEYESLNWELEVPANNGLYANWGYSGWTQEGYRLGQWMFVQWFRSGRYYYLRNATRWLREYRDVCGTFWDTPDDGPRPTDAGGYRRGGGHRHDQQHWGAYMTTYGIPNIALGHHYYMTGDGRDLDAMAENAPWILYYSQNENQGVLSVLYTGEVLNDQSLIDIAYSRTKSPSDDYGRSIYDSGMGLMLRDIQTNGNATVRARLKTWASMSENSAGFIRAYVESQEATGQYTSQLNADMQSIFPSNGSIRSYYFNWAVRNPTDFDDAFSPDIMPNGPWNWSRKMIEHVVFDAPGGQGNNPSRNMYYLQAMWFVDPNNLGPAPEDHDPPTIESVTPLSDFTHVIVVFNEAVTESSAENASHYSIDHGETVSSAVLGSDNRTVTLTTSTLSTDVTYTLTVNGIVDRSDTPNTIVANTQVTFEYQGALIHHWKLNETSGSTAVDSAGGTNGTVSGATWTTGHDSGALSFDGSNDYLDIPTAGGTGNRSEVTISMWVNPTSWGGSRTIWDEYADSGMWWQFTIQEGTWYTRDASTGTTGSRNNDLSMPSVPTGQWHHLVFVYSVAESRKAIYLDGELYNSTSTSVDQLTADRLATRVGYPSDGGYYAGKIDDIRMYDRALSANEIKALAGTLPQVVGRKVYYNISAYDNNSILADSGDDAAIATDKAALMPGETATFENYTSYSRGLNGIMVDLKNAPNAAGITAADVTVKVGNDNNPAGWTTTAPIVFVRSGAGADSSDRVQIILPDNLVANKWAQITVKATANTGLADDDVFYFGCAPGDSGNSGNDAYVNAFDSGSVRDHSTASAGITNTYDFNRDKVVNVDDFNVARNNPTNFVNGLKLITTP